MLPLLSAQIQIHSERFFATIFSFTWHFYSRGPKNDSITLRLFFTRMTAFQIPYTLDDSWAEHVKSIVSKNQVLCLVLKLFQTVNQDMCKVSEDGFSSVFVVLMVLIQFELEAEKLGLLTVISPWKSSPIILCYTSEVDPPECFKQELCILSIIHFLMVIFSIEGFVSVN